MGERQALCGNGWPAPRVPGDPTGHVGCGLDELSHKGDWLEWKSLPIRQKNPKNPPKNKNTSAWSEYVAAVGKKTGPTRFKLRGNDTRGINKRFCTVALCEFLHQTWLQLRQMEPVGCISLHYCAETGCQVTNARPREQRVIFVARGCLLITKLGNMPLLKKTQPWVSAEVICLITSL